MAGPAREGRVLQRCHDPGAMNLPLEGFRAVSATEPPGPNATMVLADLPTFCRDARCPRTRQPQQRWRPPCRRPESPAACLAYRSPLGRTMAAQSEVVLAAATVAFSPLRTVQEVVADPCLRSRETPVEDPDGTAFVRQPVGFAGVKMLTPQRAPEVGEHTNAILQAHNCPPRCRAVARKEVFCV